jgi:hypothetical protein
MSDTADGAATTGPYGVRRSDIFTSGWEVHPRDSARLPKTVRVFYGIDAEQQAKALAAKWNTEAETQRILNNPAFQAGMKAREDLLTEVFAILSEHEPAIRGPVSCGAALADRIIQAADHLRGSQTPEKTTASDVGGKVCPDCLNRDSIGIWCGRCDTEVSSYEEDPLFIQNKALQAENANLRRLNSALMSDWKRVDDENTLLKGSPWPLKAENGYREAVLCHSDAQIIQVPTHVEVVLILRGVSPPCIVK